MHHKWAIIFQLIIGLSATIVSAAPLEPATQPATRPTAADLSNPKSALLAFERLTPVGGAETAVLFFSQATLAEKRAAPAAAELEAAMARLEPLLADRFGDPSVDSIVRACGGETAEDIQAATLEMTDETTACLRWNNARRPMWFVKDAQGWKINTAELLNQFTNSDSFIWYMNNITHEVNRAADDLTAGRNLTAQAITERINRAAKR